MRISASLLQQNINGNSGENETFWAGSYKGNPFKINGESMHMGNPLGIHSKSFQNPFKISGEPTQNQWEIHPKSMGNPF